MVVGCAVTCKDNYDFIPPQVTTTEIMMTGSMTPEQDSPGNQDISTKLAQVCRMTGKHTN